MYPAKDSVYIGTHPVFVSHTKEIEQLLYFVSDLQHRLRDKGKYYGVKYNCLGRVRRKCTDLLLKLYGTAYTDQSYTDTANSIWNDNAQPTMDEQGRRCVGFAMLANVQFAINELKEAAFTNYEQITYDTKTDADGKHYYAQRSGRADDLLRDPANAADTFTVYDETIRAVIAKIDGYIASPEAVALIAKLLPESFGIEVRDYDNDGKTAMFDLLMSVLMQKVLSDDLINRIFAMIYLNLYTLMSIHLLFYLIP